MHNESTWTAFPSLLSPLRSDDQQALERAVCAGLCGRHDDCELIFTDSLANLSSMPAYVLNRADILSNSSRVFERNHLLRVFVREYEADTQQESIQILIRLMLEDSNFWLHGTCRPLVNALLVMKRHLAGKKFANLTDIQVRL